MAGGTRALILERLELGEHTVVAALGIDLEGKKHVLGLWEEVTTENAAVCRALLAELVKRGLRVHEGLLVILDGAKALRAYVVTWLAVACLVVVGPLLYDMRFDGQPLEVWAAFSLSTLAFLALGWVVGSLAPTAQTAQAGGMILAFVMMALGGAWAPLEVLGESVLRISRFLPLTHVVLLMRGVWAGNSLADHTGDLLFLGAILVIGGFLAVRLFRWE